MKKTKWVPFFLVSCVLSITNTVISSPLGPRYDGTICAGSNCPAKAFAEDLVKYVTVTKTEDVVVAETDVNCKDDCEPVIKTLKKTVVVTEVERATASPEELYGSGSRGNDNEKRHFSESSNGGKGQSFESNGEKGGTGSTVSSYTVSNSTVSSSTASSSTVSSSTVSKFSISSSDDSVNSDSYYEMIYEKVIKHNVDDLFKPVADVDLSAFKTNRLEFRLGRGVDETPGRIHTNKFYFNFMYDETSPVFANPYILTWDTDIHSGLGIKITKTEDLFLKVYTFSGEDQIPDFFISATAMSPTKRYRSITNMKQMSATVKFSPEEDQTQNYFEVPMASGMGMITAIFHGNLVPRLAIPGNIQDFSKLDFSNSKPSSSYLLLGDTDLQWLIMVTVPKGTTNFSLMRDGNKIVGNKAVEGLIIQVAVAPNDKKDRHIYEQAAGTYITGAEVKGLMSDNNAIYSISYDTNSIHEGSLRGEPIVFALPHHLDLFSDKMMMKSTDITLWSVVKGKMKAFITDKLEFSHRVNSRVGMLPLVNDTKAIYYPEQIKLLHDTLVSELDGVDVYQLIMLNPDIDSMSKAFSQYAQMLIVSSVILRDEKFTKQLFDGMAKFFKELRQGSILPSLGYEERFGSMISCNAPRFGDCKLDTIKSHHFTYGNLIYGAAIMARLDENPDGSWLQENHQFVNALVLDVANPDESNTHFPAFRLFDWFDGHSWLSGFARDSHGRHVDSLSEDVHFTYAMKMWGIAIGDPAMTARADLMLNIQKKAFNTYFLYSNDNQVMSKQTRKNRVSGIFHESELTYITVTGSGYLYHAFQMFPMTPALAFVREKEFVKLEWEEKIAPVFPVRFGGWDSILQANRALFDPLASYNYFAAAKFDPKSLADGQSRLWSLAYAAPLINNAAHDHSHISNIPTV